MTISKFWATIFLMFIGTWWFVRKLWRVKLWIIIPTSAYYLLKVILDRYTLLEIQDTLSYVSWIHWTILGLVFGIAMFMVIMNVVCDTNGGGDER